MASMTKKNVEVININIIILNALYIYIYTVEPR